MNYLNKNLRILLMLFSFSPFLLTAQSGLKMESVSIFKNHTSFFVKSGQVATKDKKWELVGDTIPQALNGTFWVSSPTKEISIIKSFLQDKEIQGLVGSYSDMLAANDGKRIRLLRNGDTVLVEGKVKVLQIPSTDKAVPAQKSNQLFAITQADGTTAMLTRQQVDGARRLEFVDSPSFTVSSVQKMPVMQVNFSTAKEKQPVNLMYLSHGLSWRPDYLIELIAEDKAKLSLRTTVINEAEDIEVAKLNMVAGAPNFKYATQISDFLNFIQVTPRLAAAQPFQANIANFSNTAVFDNEAVYGGTFGQPTLDNPGGTAAEGTDVEDLFFYTLENIVLKKGERALLDIFSAEVPVSHVYEVLLSQNSANYTQNYSFESAKTPVVHTLKLKNTTDYVWTAASAMVVKNNKGQVAPISQDLLKYTSKNDEINVKLTEAPDVAVKFTDKEVGREVNKKSVKESNNRVRYYDVVTVETEIEIQNFKNKDIKMDVKRPIIGKLLESSTKWELAPRLQAYDTYNPFTNVCWEFDVKAGTTKKITYKYEIHVSHY